MKFNNIVPAGGQYQAVADHLLAKFVARDDASGATRN